MFLIILTAFKALYKPIIALTIKFYNKDNVIIKTL